MISVNAGETKPFYPTQVNQKVTVTASGGAVGSVTAVISGVSSSYPIGPTQFIQTFGPLNAGDSVSVTIQSGSAFVTKMAPEAEIDPSTIDPYSDS